MELEVRVLGPAGYVPARSFIAALRTSLDVLDRLEPSGSASAGWVLAELRNGSAAALLQRSDGGLPEGAVRLVDGLGMLRSAPELPAFFSLEIASALLKLERVLQHDSVEGVDYTLHAEQGRDRVESLSPVVLERLRSASETRDETLGSVRGVLDVINVRRNVRRVSVYDPESRRAIICQFPQSLLSSARDALGQEVVVHGVLSRNARGQVLSVAASAIGVRSADEPVPTVDDLVGIAPWFTGGVSTDEYLRSVRGA